MTCAYAGVLEYSSILPKNIKTSATLHLTAFENKRPRLYLLLKRIGCQFFDFRAFEFLGGGQLDLTAKFQKATLHLTAFEFLGSGRF